jgi:hypothetical protein
MSGKGHRSPADFPQGQTYTTMVAEPRPFGLNSFVRVDMNGTAAMGAVRRTVLKRDD